ncbi:terminase small subunit [Salinibacter altiplanensis]|uniref:terminase small subunit n=1 Tax=Salinibacter altiplanensis TaxID=1803181 RepID=UPI000C9F7EBC|nr:terminase small subunit [Salinibacter altiplanensis]
MGVSWTTKQKRFVEEYCKDFNASAAARRAGYSEKTAGQMGHENLKKPEINQAIEERLDELAMSAAEATKRLGDIARADISDFLQVVTWTDENGNERESLAVDPEAVLEHGGGIVKGLEKSGKLKLYDAQKALKTILDAHGEFNHDQNLDVTSGGEKITTIDFRPPESDSDSDGGD